LIQASLGVVMLPLDDFRILAIEQYGAGPYATSLLADLGAEIIKIEDPSSGGDVGRYVPPFQQGEDSLFYETYNRNKKSLSLDLRNDSGRKVFLDLVGSADAVFSNLRGDVPQKIRICYNDLKHVKRSIVCCSLTGFGLTGPRSADPGYDYILQGLAGWMSLTGEPGGVPMKSGLSLVDFSSGMAAAIATMAGIHAARRSGEGMDCDLSLFDTAISLTGYLATWHLTNGFVPQRVTNSGHPSLVPFQVFRASDDWIVIGCAKEKFWRRLTSVLDYDELTDDPRFCDFSARLENKELLIPLLEKRLLTRTADEWLRQLAAEGIPSGPILSLEEALTDEQTIARNLIIETDHPLFGKVRQIGSPVKVGRSTVTPERAPQRNEHSEQILRGILHYEEETIRHLSENGAFG